jgi:serine/threonine protein kinase
MPLKAGTNLGVYQILAPLGSGGMGEVYRALDSRLGREVAIKVLSASLAGHPDRLARLDREARTVAALNHPNVVTLYSIEELDGVRFLTMELVDGRTLDDAAESGGMPLEQALQVALAISEALVAAHEKGVVHRDLKPGNVMLTRDGRVKVLDFGLAKPTREDSGLEATQSDTVSRPLSSPGQQLGTIPYMAPEQVRGRAVDTRTDLFAFGIVLYELLTGTRPFTGDNAADVTSAILRDTPPRVMALRPELPPALDALVARCLEKDPKRRFQSAREISTELRQLVRELEHSGEGATRWSSSASATASASGPPSSGTGSRALSSIAVLPFVNRSRDPEDEYFADGLADELLNVLTRIRGLRVAARTSSFQFKEQTDSPEAIGRKLNVDTLLEGSVRRSGARVRISVQLVKTADGFQLWSKSYDRALDDIFAVQDDIAQSVVHELRAALLGDASAVSDSGEVRAEVAEAAKGRGENAEAHRLFLQGRFFVSRLSAPDAEHGIELLHQALALEPRHALAWACLSWAETFVATSSSGELAPGFARARDAAARAIAIEPDVADGHLAMGEILLWYDFAWADAEATFRRALELAPQHAEALRGNAIVAYVLGRYDDALRCCRRAIEHDPLSVMAYGWLARVYREMDHLPDAERAFRKALTLSPEAVSLRAFLALVLSDQGRYEEAVAEVANEPADWARLFAQAIIQFRGGKGEASDRALAELKGPHIALAAYQIAMAHAARGEADDAFEFLERAWASRDSGIAFVRGHAVFRPLHADPRWAALIAKMKFPPTA